MTQQPAKQVPDRASLRRVLQAVLLGDSDFDAFCLDYFPAIHRRFAAGMDRMAKMNILLQQVQGAAIWSRLQDSFAVQLADYRDPLRYEPAQESATATYPYRSTTSPDPAAAPPQSAPPATSTAPAPAAPDPAPAATGLAEGQVLDGKYEILRPLGQGGMGRVYLAQRLGIGSRVAIKVLHAELSREPDIARRFFNEARLVNQVQHPSLVSIFDYGQLADGATYLVMEYLAGQSLAARLAQGPLPHGPAALRLFRQMAATLAAVHQHGFVHRDLKPDNVMLLPGDAGEERAKILDFGIAKVAQKHSQASTRSGMMMGTPLYMAPEQCHEAGSVTDRADVYSLGAIFYQVLAGQPPFTAPDLPGLLYKQVFEAPRPLRERAPGVPRDLAGLVERMLAKAPEKRPAMSEVAAALLPMQSVVLPPPPRSLGALALAGSLSALALTGAVFGYRSGCRTEHAVSPTKQADAAQPPAPSQNQAPATPPDLAVPAPALPTEAPPAEVGTVRRRTQPSDPQPGRGTPPAPPEVPLFHRRGGK